jgi:LysM repeat protein
VGGLRVVEHEPHKRVWAARLAAPAAFFVAAIALVVLIQRGLDEGSSTAANTTPVVTTTPTTTSGTTTETTPPQRQNYRVRRGDTLESIAAKFDTTVDDLLQLNPDVDPLALSPGQRIRVS